MPHNDVDAVTAALRGRSQRRALVIAESVYSVLGDAAPVGQLATAATEHDAVLVIDEAHALGVAGAGGRGLVADAGLAGALDIVVTATLSKAFGSQGGAILASEAVVDHLVNTARPFIYDTGLAPAAAAAALESVRIVEQTPELPARARDIASRMARALGLDDPAGAVLSVPLDRPDEALRGSGEAGCRRLPRRLLPSAVDARRRLADPVVGPRDPHRRAGRPGRRAAGRHRRRAMMESLPFHVLMTGTSTGVGKTIATAAYAAALAAGGWRVAVVKPVQTGVATGEPSDAETVRLLTGLDDVYELASLPDPLAPDTAARLRNLTTPSVGTLAEQIAVGAGTADIVLIEGSGGVLVRLDTDGGTLLDLEALSRVLATRSLPSSSRALALGTLNHTELTVQAMRSAGLGGAGLVSGPCPSSPTWPSLQSWTSCRG